MANNRPHEVQQEILKSAKQGRKWQLHHETGTIDFRMTPPDRVLRSEAQNAIPSSFIDAVEHEIKDSQQDIEDIEENFDEEDLLGDESEIDPKDAVLGGEATAKLDELLKDSLEHNTLSDREINEIVDVLPDPLFYEAAFAALDMGAGVDESETIQFREK